MMAIQVPTETDSLVPTDRSFRTPSQRTFCVLSTCAPRRICVPSKPALVIFAWTFVVGTAFFSFSAFLNLSMIHLPDVISFTSILVTHCVLAVFILFYPLAGFLADVCCGRYRVIVISVGLLWLSTILLTISLGLGYAYLYDAINVFAALGGIFIFLGVSGYRSNIIQFGFDQLLEVPSCYLGMFVHWYLWSDSLGNVLVQVKVTLQTCSHVHIFNATVGKVLHASLMVCFPIFTSFLIVICILHKRQFFHTEVARYNPYKLILKVFVFACKNKHPVRRPSAFVYCDNRRATRMDFAKERFGGPFDNSDVEDVKTFGRVLCVLLSLAPVFILEVPVSYTVFSVLTLHSGTNSSYNNMTCTAEWAILGSGNLSYIFEVVFLPVYIWLVFSVLRNRIPRIFVRLGFSVLLYIMAVVSMLLVDLTGHIALDVEQKPNVMCMFVQPIPLHESEYKTLSLHWAMLILPNLLIGIAPKLVMASSLEFISAQTPHSMKGVMIGMLFAIKGLSQLVSATLVVPFSFPLWKHGHLGHNPPVASCGSGYFLLTIFIAVIGLVCFVVCARKYKYRVRDEEGFSQNDVEEVFERRLQLQQEQGRRLPVFMDSPTSDYDSLPMPDEDAIGENQDFVTRTMSYPQTWYGSIERNT